MLRMESVAHAYGSRLVLEGIDLQLGAGQILSLIGQSGCGKTTLLHIAAGLITPTHGQVQNQFSRPAYVFQEPRLLPWRTSWQNIAYGLKVTGQSEQEQRRIALALVERLGLSGAEMKYPHQLSGGMRQRVALGRALAVEPDLLLLDEPFGALDPGLRSEMQSLLLELLSERQIAALFVTHDLAEAVRLGDELIALSPGPGRIVAREKLGRSPRDCSAVELLQQVDQIRNRIAAAYST